MNKEIGIKDILESIKTAHIKLDTFFLINMLHTTSGSLNPNKDELFCKRINCPFNKNKKSSTTIYGWIKGYRTLPILKLKKIVELSKHPWKDVETNVISIKSGIRKGEICPRFPITIDYRLGSIIGHILGDGSIEKRFHSLFYSNSNPELLREFSSYMKNIFGIDPRIWIQDKPKYGETKWLKRIDNLNNPPEGHNVGLFYPKICSDILYAIFDRFAEGKNKVITAKIKNSNSDFLRGLLRAFFDDEGSVRANNYTVRFHQDKKEILEFMRKIIIGFGIKPKKVRSYLKKEKLRYYFNITGFKEYSTFYKTVGCTSSSKQKEFEILINKKK